MFLPELLLPAGSVETFFAAVEGGADAVYLGLRKFNARNRAKNFSYADLQNVVAEANRRNVKVYVTLNTLIKNAELAELIDILSVLNQIKPHALIVQDLAVANIVVNYFPKLQIHASTQMAVHNSTSCNFLCDRGFSRVVLARELTLHELSQVVKNTKVETEIFVHGALCYSMSGQCLFSSYLGGNSANRGLCTQVCRRKFKTDAGSSPLFSMKDFQLIDFLPQFTALGVSSLKVEGRMKTPDYVYNVARAYRLALDDNSKIEEAKCILNTDFAREKTLWFIGKDVKNAITTKSETGCFAGKIESLFANGFTITSNVLLTKNAKLRCRNNNDTEAEYLKISAISNIGKEYTITTDAGNLFVGQEVYLVGYNDYDFRTRFAKQAIKALQPISRQRVEAIKRSFAVVGSKNADLRLFLRVGSIENLQAVDITKYEAVFLKVPLLHLRKLVSLRFGSLLRQKIFVELPKYISELSLKEWQKVIVELQNAGFNRFVISNIAQKSLFDLRCVIAANESVYLLNDISVNFVKESGIRHYCYSCESDYPNLISGRDRGGIIPLYFRPQLFYSRQPISATHLRDDNGVVYAKWAEEGFTVVADKRAVSWVQNVEKFRAKGFTRFLIDVSGKGDFENLEIILQSLNKGKKVQNSVDFNMKKGLK